MKKVYSLTFVCRAFVEARADLDAEVKETQLEDPFILPSMSGCLLKKMPHHFETYPCLVFENNGKNEIQALAE